MSSSHTPIPHTLKLTVLCAALNSCNLGYDLGISADLAPLLKQAFDLSPDSISMFIGSLNLCALVGAFFSPKISDVFGRRFSFAISSVFFIVGLTVQAASPSFPCLMIGRCLLGLAVGFGLAIDPLYISEVTPPSLRGALVSYSEIAINVGILLGFVIGFAFEGLPENRNWRLMILMGTIMPNIILFVIYKNIMPESPRWLMQRGRREEALEVFSKIYEGGESAYVSEMISDIEASIAEEKAISGGEITWATCVLTPPPFLKRMLLVGVGVAFIQQITGIDGVQYYMAFLLEASGISSRSARFGYMVLFGTLKTLAVVLAAPRFDSFGRRPMLLCSLTIMTLGLISIFSNLMMDSQFPSLAIIGVVIYYVGFSIGVGPVCWLIPSEIFPNVVRAKAMALTTVINRTASTFVSSTVLSLSSAMTWGGYYVALAFINVLAFIFVYYVVPETKGKTLEEMLAFFQTLADEKGEKNQFGDIMMTKVRTSSIGSVEEEEEEEEEAPPTPPPQSTPYDMTSIIPSNSDETESENLDTVEI